MIELNRTALAYFAAAVLALPVTAAELGTQQSSDRGVTVAVTPQNLSAGAKTWDFKIVLDTHSADLSDDLVKSVVLLDGTGGKHMPIAWDGAEPGGHHREGVLRFKLVSPRPKAIELQITRPGEAKPRSFRWQLN
jgi:hypothetical protein